MKKVKPEDFRKHNKKVAIVGMAKTTRDDAPFDVEDIEIWSLNEAYRFGYLKRETRHFQIHPSWDYRRKNNRNDGKHWEWLRTQTDVPVYMQRKDPQVPMSIEYPLEAVATFLGDDYYFTSGIAYMLALAIYEGYDWIGIYGVEMAATTEYFYQKACMEYLIGFAKGKGITVYLPPGCALLSDTLYGYEDLRAGSSTALMASVRELLKDENQAIREKLVMQGRKDELEYLLDTHGENKEFSLMTLVKELHERTSQYIAWVETSGNKTGARSQAEELVKWLQMQATPAARFGYFVDPKEQYAFEHSEEMRKKSAEISSLKYAIEAKKESNHKALQSQSLDDQLKRLQAQLDYLEGELDATTTE